MTEKRLSECPWERIPESEDGMFRLDLGDFLSQEQLDRIPWTNPTLFIAQGTHAQGAVSCPYVAYADARKDAPDMGDYLRVTLKAADGMIMSCQLHGCMDASTFGGELPVDLASIMVEISLNQEAEDWIARHHEVLEKVRKPSNDRSDQSR